MRRQGPAPRPGSGRTLNHSHGLPPQPIGPYPPPYSGPPPPPIPLFPIYGVEMSEMEGVDLFYHVILEDRVKIASFWNILLLT
jgi:hypothetical protein